ncbi:MAG: caspase family protein [Deltaproteobacteria bacterium]|nr:caspase family protein [Deltaproteobacteria bacterium]
MLAYLGPKRKYELTLVRDGAPLTVVADKQGERLGLSLRLVPVLPPETAERQVAFDVKASDDEIALDRLNVYVNEVPIFGLRGRKLEGKEALAHVDAPLLPGRNLVQVSVTNAKGAESLRESYEVTCKAPPRPSKVVLLAVGVSQYADARMNLTYAAKDAQDLAALLTAHGGNVQVVPVLDTAATREGILAAKQQLLATAPEDEVIVFYAGHGLLDEKLDYFLATTDVDYEHPAAKGLPYEELEGLVDGVPALRRLVLVDACHSGEVDKDDATLAAANLSDGPVKSRGLKVVARKHLGVKSAADLAAELFADLRRGSGAAVIASASGTEVAFESSEWNNGVFTYALLEGLRAGKTHVSELRDYTSARVKELTHGQQTPTARRENLEFDFSVW